MQTPYEATSASQELNEGYAPEQIIRLRNLNGDSMVQEAIKTLRSNIEFSGENIRTICVTSALPGDGKSTNAFRLACAFGQSGRSVLLIDVDLRRSVMRRQIKSGSPECGLSHYLVGRANYEETVYGTNMPGLSVVFSGPFPPNPSELLGNVRFKDFVERAKSEYDVIIVDTAPIGSVIDAAVVARVCDGVLFVIKDGEVSYRLAQKCKEQLEAAGTRILGCVLTEVELSSSRYYGKYYGKYYGSYYK